MHRRSIIPSHAPSSSNNHSTLELPCTSLLRIATFRSCSHQLDEVSIRAQWPSTWRGDFDATRETVEAVLLCVVVMLSQSSSPRSNRRGPVSNTLSAVGKHPLPPTPCVFKTPDTSSLNKTVMNCTSTPSMQRR